MSEIVQMADLSNPENIYRLCKETKELVYVAEGEELKMVIMDISVHEQLLRQIVAAKRPKKQMEYNH